MSFVEDSNRADQVVLRTWDADHSVLRTLNLGFPTQVLIKIAPQTSIPERTQRMLRDPDRDGEALGTEEVSTQLKDEVPRL